MKNKPIRYRKTRKKSCSGKSQIFTRSHVIDALLCSFLAADVIQDVYKYISEHIKERNIMKQSSPLRFSKDICLLLHVFRKSEVLNYFISVLKPAVRDLVFQHVQIMETVDTNYFNALKQASISVWKSQRSLLG